MVSFFIEQPLRCQILKSRKKESIQLIHSAVEQGITFFDTAQGRGENELLVGEALEPFRKEVKTATKFGFKDGNVRLALDSRPENIIAVAEASLRRKINAALATIKIVGERCIA